MNHKVVMTPIEVELVNLGGAYDPKPAATKKSPD